MRALERLGVSLLRVLTYAVVAVVLIVLGDVLRHGVPALSWEVLTAMPRQAGAAGGIFPAILGTLLLVAGAMLVALPAGVGAAIWLAEYAHGGWFTTAVRTGIITLAGVPSIVFGLFGMSVFVIYLGFGASILAGSLTLALMVLPVIIVATEEALLAVPAAWRDASTALGATRWQTTWHIVLPAALPGILTGSILATGRAAGETAPILLTCAAFFLPRLPHSPFDQVMALPYHLYILATQHSDPRVRPMQYATALVLLAVVLGMNAAAVFVRYRLRRER